MVDDAEEATSDSQALFEEFQRMKLENEAQCLYGATTNRKPFSYDKRRFRAAGRPPRPRSTPNVPPSAKCYRCGGVGHYAQQCATPVSMGIPQSPVLPDEHRIFQSNTISNNNPTNTQLSDVKQTVKNLVSLKAAQSNQSTQDFLGVFTSAETSLVLPTRNNTEFCIGEATKLNSNPVNNKQDPHKFHINSGQETVQISVPSGTVSTPKIDLEKSESIPNIENATEFFNAPSIYTTDDMLCSHISTKRLLFWVAAAIQDRNLWVLADTGSCRNLLSEKFFESLPISPRLAAPGATVVVAGDGKELDLLGWATVNFEIAGKMVYHEFGVVKDLPVDFLLGGEFMKPHACTLQYATTGRNRFQIGIDFCSSCNLNLVTIKTHQPELIKPISPKKPLGKLRTLVTISSNFETVSAREDPLVAARRVKMEKVVK